MAGSEEVRPLYRNIRWSFMTGMTPVVKYLIFLNAGIFIAGLLLPAGLPADLGLVPAQVWRGAVWQPLTYMFLHGGIFHLIFNMLVLWMFGSTLESTWGARRFLIFYFICGIGAGLLNAVVTPTSPVPVMGASGAIYGLLMAFAILFPEQLIYFWGIFPIKAKYFVIGIGVIELLTAMGTQGSGIAHIAHLGGMLFGLIYMKGGDWRRSISTARTEKRRSRHLKVVYDRELERRKIQQEIDTILDKAARGGSDALTAAERERFSALSRKLEELENRG